MTMRAVNQYLDGGTEGCTLASRMRYARRKSGLSVKDAAARIGWSESTLRRIENGAVQMVQCGRTLDNAGKVYGVSSVWLYAGSIAGKRFAPQGYDPRTSL